MSHLPRVSHVYLCVCLSMCTCHYGREYDCAQATILAADWLIDLEQRYAALYDEHQDLLVLLVRGAAVLATVSVVVV